MLHSAFTQYKTDMNAPEPPVLDRFRHLGRALLGQLLPRACLLCQAPCADQPLCPLCQPALPGRDVPRCPICALRLDSHHPDAGTDRASHPNGILNQACRKASKNHTSAPLTCPYHQRFHPHLTQVICLADYAPPLDQVLGSLKFGQQAALGLALGELLIQKISLMPDNPLTKMDALIPIPLSGPRLAERGFNQSHQIARGMKASAGQRLPPIRTGWLRRLRHTAAQSSLDADQRQTNLLGVFRASPEVAGRHVALIDDVMTTGSTLLAAAAALKAIGAHTVSAFIIARTPEPGGPPPTPAS